MPEGRILIVEHHELNRDMLSRRLRRQGYAVTQASDGTEALEKLNSCEFDLMFLDLKMPGMDGADLFGLIRELKPELPVAVITGYPDSEMMARALAHGPLMVMNKPFGEAEIAGAVNVFLRVRRR